MSRQLAQTSGWQRSSLLGLVVGLHLAAVLALVASKSTPVKIVEIPMMVDLLPPAPIENKQRAPVPPPSPQPQVTKTVAKPSPAPQKAPTAPLEATSSTTPAPSAPLAAPAESKPAPSAPPAPPSPPAISPARFDPDYLRNPAPPYPPLAKRMGEEGKVVLRVSVNPQGSADSVDISKSSGSSRLDEAAQKTVRNWKFVPAKQGENAVQSWVLVPIIFKLEQ
jgi:periplasmic protein TonB